MDKKIKPLKLRGFLLIKNPVSKNQQNSKYLFKNKHHDVTCLNRK